MLYYATPADSKAESGEVDPLLSKFIIEMLYYATPAHLKAETCGSCIKSIRIYLYCATPANVKTET